MLNNYIDIYCERLEPGLWAEPLNAITNGAFIIAGIFALLLARKEKAFQPSNLILITLIFAMGIGSTLFHTFATFWAMLTDVIPILLFQISFIIFYSRNVIRLKAWQIAGLLIVFIALMQGAMQLPREWLNGTLEYAPALIFVSGFGLWHLKNATREAWGLLSAAALFALSMTFRSIDNALCEAIPMGTHFAWHILNAVVLYLCARAYVLNRN